MRLIGFIGLFCLAMGNAIANTHIANDCSISEAKDHLKHYQWLAEDYPPYNYVDHEGNITGIFTDTLAMIYQELAIPFKLRDIAVVPWARLYRTLELDDSYAAFSMVNTPERLHKFKLVPLPVITKVSIIVLDERYDYLASQPIDQLHIAVVRDDIGQHMLDENGIRAKQVETTSAFSMLRMLVHGRVDAIAYAEDVASFQYQKLAITGGATRTLQVLNDSSYTNYVFHLNTPECVISLVEATINRLQKQGKLEQVWRRYLPQTTR
ncbi:substrate-binding periplasmic protein [Thalassotalea fusca]